MKWSKTGVKTLKEVPADTALPSHALLVRGGFIKKLTSGIFTYGPFMVRAIHKFENIVREELNKKNCVEILMPMVQPTELWRQSERLHIYGDLLQKMKNRTGQEFCLGPTHEEVISNYIKNNINSYRDLPFCLYQIQNKFRDEIRPRFGLMRAREFIMKDAYSFDLNEEQAKESYKKMESVYQAIFSRLDIPFRAVKADSGEIGGDLSEEFHILAEHGEDELLFTDSFAANKEICPDVKPGDKGPDNQVLRSCRGIEVGHIFYLGDKYSKKMKLHYLDQQGNKQTVKMGCYGIGITRTIQAVVEHSHDKNGIIWPKAIAPFLVHICLLDPEDQKTRDLANHLYQSLCKKGIDTFLDDRDEKPGVKFKDADLLGFPLRINLGTRDRIKNLVELVTRPTGKREKVPIASALEKILSFFYTKPV